MKPNRTQLTIALILMTLALILAIYFGKRGTLMRASATGGGKASSIRELVAQPVDIQSGVQNMGKSLPLDCGILWTRIAAGTFEEFRNYTDDDKTRMITCSQSAPLLAKHDPQHIEKLRDSCSTPDEEGSNAMASNCSLYFYFYKAAVVAFFNGEKAPAEFATNELALLVFHEYNNLDTRRLPYLSQLVNELASRDPAYSILKAKASIQLFQLMDNGNAGRSAELIQTLKDLQTQNPDDEQLFEMHFVALAMQNDGTEMNELTEKYSQDHPSSATGYYIRSAYFWQQKNREKTIELLKNAIALEPMNPRYMETRQKVEDAPLGSPGLYNVNVNFDLINE